MDAFLQKIMGVVIVVFMVGNLLEVGLRLRVAEAFAALRDARFVVVSLLWCFVLLLFVMIPLIIGVAIRRAAERAAEQAAPIVRKVTGLDTLMLGACLLWLYRSEIFGAVGTYDRYERIDYE